MSDDTQPGPHAVHSTGVALPLSALRRRGSVIGEYTELSNFGRWAASCGFDLIQVLPLSDTGEDNSPYAGIASVGLHPIYLDLDAIAVDMGESAPGPKYRQQQQQLAELDRIDYATVLHAKKAELRRLFQSRPLEHWRRQVEPFAQANPWVHEVAAFCILMEQHDGRPWWQWPDRQDPKTHDLAGILENNEDSWLYHCWLQMHADRQLSRAVAELAELGISLMGDLPILVQKNSADVWWHRRYFDLSGRAGAPPDRYCEQGQDWGFPLFDWDRLKKEQYSWWRRRLEHASRYYRLLRIDHVLGFFRIWRIENESSTAVEGHYVPTLALDTDELAAIGFDTPRIEEWSGPDGVFEALRHDTGGIGLRFEWQKSPRWDALDTGTKQALREICQANQRARVRLWAEHGRARLRALQSATDMVFCAEDLGAVPACVPQVLEELSIAGLKVERWCRAEDEADRPFWDPAHFPRRSVCSPGLHDASSIRGWWREIDDETRALYFYRAIGGQGAVPEDLDPDALARVFARNLRANSERVILHLPDLLALDEELRPDDPDDERINWPGTIGPRNWSWRLPLSGDELAGRTAWTARLKTLIAARHP